MKKVTVRVPGSCGELLQGTWRGKPLLVTCPIDRYSQVTIEVGERESLPLKAEQMARLASDFYQVSLDGLKIQLQSELPIGKGMSSSSADTAAVGAAIGLWGGKEIDPQKLLELCQKIEPTDGTFFEGILYLDHIDGEYVGSLPHPPKMKIQIFDCGGEVDTIHFNERKDLCDLNSKKEPAIEKAFISLQEALEKGDQKKLAQSATFSALAHQEILPKPNLEEIISQLEEWGALGITVAHSGTVIGVLWSTESKEEQRNHVKDALSQKWSEYRFWSEAHLISGGIFFEIQ